MRLCTKCCPGSSAKTASSTRQSSGSAAQAGPGTGQPAEAVATQLGLNPCLLLAQHNLFQCPGSNKEASCTQKDAPELVPELGWKAVQGQRPVSEEEAAGHEEMGKHDDHECDGNERGIAGGTQAVRPGIQLEAHDLPLQNVVCNRPGDSDHRILQQ